MQAGARPCQTSHAKPDGASFKADDVAYSSACNTCAGSLRRYCRFSDLRASLHHRSFPWHRRHCKMAMAATNLATATCCRSIIAMLDHSSTLLLNRAHSRTLGVIYRPTRSLAPTAFPATAPRSWDTDPFCRCHQSRSWRRKRYRQAGKSMSPPSVHDLLSI